MGCSQGLSPAAHPQLQAPLPFCLPRMQSFAWSMSHAVAVRLLRLPSQLLLSPPATSSASSSFSPTATSHTYILPCPLARFFTFTFFPFHSAGLLVSRYTIVLPTYTAHFISSPLPSRVPPPTLPTLLTLLASTRSLRPASPSAALITSPSLFFTYSRSLLLANCLFRPGQSLLQESSQLSLFDATLVVLTQHQHQHSTQPPHTPRDAF